MPHEMNSLVEIPTTDWTKLLDLYIDQANLPCAYGLLLTAIRCIDQNPDLEIRIYCLNGDWKSDGTFVMNDHGSIYFNTLNSNLGRIIDALNCLDPKTKFLFCGIPQRLLPAIEQHFIDFGLKAEDFKPDGTIWYHIPHEIVQRFTIEIPVGFTLGPVERRHAEEINNVWPHKNLGSVEFVSRLIRYNESVGAFDSHGKLVAWCLQLPLGSLGLLHVDEAHRRRGFGQLMVRCMDKKLADKNLELMASVIFTNKPSRSMFESLGAREVDRAYWGWRPAKK